MKSFVTAWFAGNGSVVSGVRNSINKSSHSPAPKLQNSLSRGGPAEEEMRTAFKVFDMDGNGLIDAEELKLTMQSLDEILTDKDVEAMILAVDRNGDGKVDYEGLSANTFLFIYFI